MRVERVLGPDHLETLESRTNLAGAYREAGRLEEAIAHPWPPSPQPCVLAPSLPEPTGEPEGWMKRSPYSSRPPKSMSESSAVITPTRLRAAVILLTQCAALALDEMAAVHERTLRCVSECLT